jgi:predicted kinase
MSRLVLICGMPGAGKTTLARRMAQERRLVRLCPEDWLAGLGLDLQDELALVDRPPAHPPTA